MWRPNVELKYQNAHQLQRKEQLGAFWIAINFHYIVLCPHTVNTANNNEIDKGNRERMYLVIVYTSKNGWNDKSERTL